LFFHESAIRNIPIERRDQAIVKDQCNRDEQWRDFLKKEQDRSIAAYRDVAEQMKAITTQIKAHSDLLSSHDARVDKLSQKVDDFIDRNEGVRKTGSRKMIGGV
jgi:hypothetical protein